MRRLTYILVFLAALQVNASSGGLGAETFLQNIAGHWLGTGESEDADGKITTIQEDWSGRFLEDGSFEMSGRRIWGEETQEFSWKFLHNPSLDLYECDYWHTGMDSELRFEAFFTETGVEMKAPMGDAGGELIISNQLADGVIDGRFTLVEAGDRVVFSGTVKHRKVEGGQE